MSRNYHAERYASDPVYRETKKAISRQWWATHRARGVAAQRARYAANREAMRAHSKVRRADPVRRERARLKAAEWRAKHPGRDRRAAERASYLKCAYGLSTQAFEAMVSNQDGRCAICDTTMKNNWRCIDHDHQTGQIRALLCNPCNCVLGLAKDDPAILRAAAVYLEHHRAAAVA